MRSSHLLLGAAAAGLVGLGVWIGRSPSSTSEAAPAPAAQVAAAPRSAAIPAPTAQPALPPRVAPPSRALQADLQDSDPKVRRSAVSELAKHPESDPQTLLAMSRDPDANVGLLATEGLGKLHAAGQLPAAELIQRASDRGLDEKVRLTAINGLGVVPSPEAAQFLADLLAKGDTFDRLNAAILIGHQDLEIAMPALIRALGDSEERVRANAAETLRARSRGRDFGTDAAAWQAWWQARPR